MIPRLVLAGLGHAHLFVLEALQNGAFAPCEVIVCNAEPLHVYSGMVPGWLGGRYAESELSLDIASVCARSGATWEPHHVVALNADQSFVRLDDGRELTFDVCSVAIGSKPAGLETPGAREHATPLKPLQQVETIKQRLTTLGSFRSGAVTIVGGGLAGIEMALAARAQLRQTGDRGDAVTVRIVNREPQLYVARGHRLSRLLADACAQLAVRVENDVEVSGVSARDVALRDGRQLASDIVIWATGPAAAPWLRDSGLAVDASGFVLVNEHLQSTTCRRVFAAGDCATLAYAPDTPKAGVYAVRMGPPLAQSLAQALRGELLSAQYQPQRRWLTLVNTGDGRAIASWGPFAIRGKWAMRWKDRIDRAFIARFREPPNGI